MVRLSVINDAPLLRGSSFGLLTVQMRCLAEQECCLALVSSQHVDYVSASLMLLKLVYYRDP